MAFRSRGRPLPVPGYGAALSLAAVTGPKAARPASALRAVADVVAEAAEEATPAKEAAAAAPPRAPPPLGSVPLH